MSAITAPGRYGDGGGLWLQVSPRGTKSWLLRYMLAGRARHMGLGPVALLTLAEARERARAERRRLLDGVDPLEARREKRAAAAIAAANGITFRQCAERYIVANEPAWRNAVHRRQWRSTLATYVYPVFGDLPVAAIETSLVTTALEPIWTVKPETASRVRGRIESILDWAKARGYRVGENPARWRGHLDKLLPNGRKVRRVRHHAALPYPDIPAFVATLRAREGTAPRSLEFAILTAARTEEVVGATWTELNLTARTWTIAAERMKSGREHRIPLADAALQVLKDLPREEGNPHVFIGGRRGKPLSNMAMLMLLKTKKGLGRPDLTVHGFRSTFRDWVAERTNFPSEVAEMALAHVVDDKVEAAYRRGDLLERRRRLMTEWARYCNDPNANVSQVIPLREKVEER